MQKKDNAYEAPSLFTKIYQLLMKFPLLQNIRGLFYFIDGVFLLFIKKPKKQAGEKKKLLIIVSFALGDCIMFIKAMEGLRELYSSDQWEITVTCQRACSVLFKDLADHVIGLEYTKASVDLKTRFDNYKEIRKVNYDLIIDPISSSDCSPNVFMSRAAIGDKKIGVLEWEPRKYQCPKWMRKKIYDEVINISKKDLHRIKLYEEVVRALGYKDFVGEVAKINSEECKELDLPEKFFVLFPSASLKVKKWPLDRCAEIADRIYRTTGYPLVLCGTEHDRADAEKMLSFSKENIEVIDCIGKTNVLQLAGVIGKAAFVVTNDTSVYHIAVSMNRKTFLLCGGYVYKRFANYDYDSINNPVLIYKWRKCFDCNNNCNQSFDETYPCVFDITVDAVWEELSKYFKEELVIEVN